MALIIGSLQKIRLKSPGVIIVQGELLLAVALSLNHALNHTLKKLDMDYSLGESFKMSISKEQMCKTSFICCSSEKFEFGQK